MKYESNRLLNLHKRLLDKLYLFIKDPFVNNWI